MSDCEPENHLHLHLDAVRKCALGADAKARRSSLQGPSHPNYVPPRPTDYLSIYIHEDNMKTQTNTGSTKLVCQKCVPNLVLNL